MIPEIYLAVAAILVVFAAIIIGFAIAYSNSAGSGYSEAARQAQRDAADLMRRANQ